MSKWSWLFHQCSVLLAWNAYGGVHGLKDFPFEGIQSKFAFRGHWTMQIFAILCPCKIWALSIPIPLAYKFPEHWKVPQGYIWSCPQHAFSCESSGHLDTTASLFEDTLVFSQRLCLFSLYIAVVSRQVLASTGESNRKEIVSKARLKSFKN